MPQSWLRSCFSLLMFPGLCTGRARSGRAWKSVSSVPRGAEQVPGSRRERGACWGLPVLAVRRWDGGNPAGDPDVDIGLCLGFPSLSLGFASVCFRRDGGTREFCCFPCFLGWPRQPPRAGSAQDAPPRRGPRAGSQLPALLLQAKPSPALAPAAADSEHVLATRCSLPRETAAPGT